MTRGEFAYAIAKTCEMMGETEKVMEIEEPLFKDVPREHKYLTIYK